MIPDRGVIQRTFWENAAETKWGSYITEVERRVILEAHAISKGPGACLEVGCEGGRWSKLLFDLGWDVLCTDVNREMLAVCQERIPRATCIPADPKDISLPCKDESMGLVLCIEVIQVIQQDWFIKEAFRVLRPGGTIVGVFDNKFSLRGCFYRLTYPFRKRPDFYYKVSYPVWRGRLLREGFKMVYEEGICWFPFSRGSNSPLVPFFTTMERVLGLRHLPGISPWVVFSAQK